MSSHDEVIRLNHRQGCMNDELPTTPLFKANHFSSIPIWKEKNFSYPGSCTVFTCTSEYSDDQMFYFSFLWPKSKHWDFVWQSKSILGHFIWCTHLSWCACFSEAGWTTSRCEPTSQKPWLNLKIQKFFAQLISSFSSFFFSLSVNLC